MTGDSDNELGILNHHRVSGFTTKQTLAKNSLQVNFLGQIAGGKMTQSVLLKHAIKRTHRIMTQPTVNHITHLIQRTRHRNGVGNESLHIADYNRRIVPNLNNLLCLLETSRVHRSHLMTTVNKNDIELTMQGGQCERNQSV